MDTLALNPLAPPKYVDRGLSQPPAYAGRSKRAAKIVALLLRTSACKGTGRNPIGRSQKYLRATIVLNVIVKARQRRVSSVRAKSQASLFGCGSLSYGKRT